MRSLSNSPSEQADLVASAVPLASTPGMGDLPWRGASDGGTTDRVRAHSEIDVDVVIPVYNEQEALGTSVQRLHQFLSQEFPFSWRIIIADNASTDLTPDIARTLVAQLTGVRLLHLEEKGRGRALRAAWSQSTARVVCYMDVDLSTDLKGLLPLVAPLLSGHSDLAIGTRLASGSRVTRGAKREFIFRSYNHLLRAALRARFSDAQCGFKAVRSDVLPELLADVRDQAWFFDTELLVLAQRRGLRKHEVPVDWVDDANSSVHITATALADLRGVARMACTATTGAPGTRRHLTDRAAHRRSNGVLNSARPGAAHR